MIVIAVVNEIPFAMNLHALMQLTMQNALEIEKCLKQSEMLNENVAES